MLRAVLRGGALQILSGRARLSLNVLPGFPSVWDDPI